ncbi:MULTISPECIES: roadblock/LC7 domain-containing protein [unclassified Amycolatopsis]|uniref:roadblock/LC7 domain-containing protein n=1 Tax=unclassified Amycolatopsis TaxID=2618356 RepID=UPI0028767AD8|nr:MULTISPECIES: roadblock/LC7 domain-containing protein [unclassified Amycolatopsis]MDS0137260.1 roadblock/LC7 domain-containing protein [Amycolatopsis sp. 505]MDS0141455.1 roadblock/LC7 domain-containing protein [Amycolatopsis sp. CM201R]
MPAEVPGTPVPLPTRKLGATPAFPVQKGPREAHPDAKAAAKALDEIRDRVDRANITGLLVASRDGLLLASDTREIEDDSVAAMSAAAVGLATRFIGQAGLGEARGAMFQGSLGHVCVFPVQGPILLVVFARPDTTMGLFNVVARQALTLLQDALTTAN